MLSQLPLKQWARRIEFYRVLQPENEVLNATVELLRGITVLWIYEKKLKMLGVLWRRNDRGVTNENRELGDAAWGELWRWVWGRPSGIRIQDSGPRGHPAIMRQVMWRDLEDNGTRRQGDGVLR